MMMTIVTMCVPGAFEKEATRAWPKKLKREVEQPRVQVGLCQW